MKLDVLFTEATVYDGKGGKPIIDNVGVKREKIVYPVERGVEKSAARIIDACGLALAPGFINIHSHSDGCLLADGTVPSVILQGITTEVVGNCGYSLAPLAKDSLAEARKELKKVFDLNVTWRNFDEYFLLLEENRVAPNVMSFVGHGTLRGSVMGMDDRKMTAEEMLRMKEEVFKAIAQGAVGLSSGLVYPPGCFAATDELIELCQIAAPLRGIYASHIRGEGDRLYPAIDEALTIGMKAKIPVEINHLKAAGRKNWGKTDKVLRMIESARKKGLFVQQDQYPYTASSTGLSMLIPEWALDGGTDEMIARMKHPSTREKILHQMREAGLESIEKILISSVSLEKNKSYEGEEVLDIARRENRDPFEFILDFLVEEENFVGAIFFSMDEEDVKRVMADPYTSIGNDAGAYSPEGVLSGDKPHPRTYGTFPRVLGHYCRDLGLFPMQEAIRKMTSLPAHMLGLTDRGVIEQGKWADIVVFNPQVIEDKATYGNPHKFSTGIEYVLVNGVMVVENGSITGEKPGRVVRNPRYVI